MIIFIRYSILCVLFSTLSTLSSVIQAQAFTTFDARSVGMGGSSVASSRLANAAYSNPALVSEPHGDENIQLLLPVLGIYYADSKGLIDDVRDFNTAVDDIDATAADAILSRSLGKPLSVNAYAGAAVGFAVNSFALVLIYNKQYFFDARTSGVSFIDALLEARGLEVTEVGIAIPLYSSDSFRIGITPKIINVNSYDYTEILINVDPDTSIISKEFGKTAHGSSSNIDLGGIYNFNNGFELGLVARNLNSQVYTTVLGNVIKLEPLIRAGLAYNGDLFTIAIDADLSKNNAIAFGEDTQIISLGAEFNMFDWVAIRVGQQQNTASQTGQSMNSVGFGFTPFGVGLDVAVIGNSNAKGGTAQLSFTF